MKTSSTKGLPPPARHVAWLLLACVFAVLWGTPANAELISTADLNAGLARAAADLIADKTACDQWTGTPRDVCRERALAKERVTRAELVVASTGTRMAHDHLAAVKVDTAYDIARTQCNDKTADAKHACTRQAQTLRTQGQADLKRHQHKSEGAVDRGRVSDDKPAADKCDPLASDAAANCPPTAKPNKGGKN
ncbi:hypothetical protein ACS5PN_16615 [Roseateles sp. NT4]|uniref:hypothetical protein n=1 Tax=Roseateles sp. NT4 TaxID=3453715 RepID=UPI003EEA25E2